MHITHCFTIKKPERFGANSSLFQVGFLLGKIYCHSGSRFTGVTENEISNVIDILDLTNKSGTASVDLKGLWESVSYDKDGIDLTPRADPQCVVLGDQNRIIVNGSYINGAVSKDMNIMYNALENKWYPHSAYTEAPYGKRQMLVYDIAEPYKPPLFIHQDVQHTY